MVFKRTDSLAAIADGLALIKLSCEQRGWLKLFDNHVVAQHFFRRFLNVAFGLRLVEMDQIQANYPAIDLGDTTNRVAYQITAERRSDKVQRTLDKFVEHGLEKQYDTLRILIIGDRQATYKPVVVPPPLRFDRDRDIIGIEELVKQLGTLESDILGKLQVILDEEVRCPAGGLAGLTSDVGVERDPPNDGKAIPALAPQRPTIRENSAAEILANLKGVTLPYKFRERFEELYLGRWTREPGWQVTVKGLPSKRSGGGWICSFREVGSDILVTAITVQDISALRPGDAVTVSGRINDVWQALPIGLEDAIVRGDNVPFP